MRSKLLGAAVYLVGCGGSDSSNATLDAAVDSSTASDTLSSPDARIDPTKKCYFTGDWIVDGVTRGIRAEGCGFGTTNAGLVQANLTEQQGSERLQISFYLDEPIAPGYTGPIRVKNIKAYISTASVERKWIGTSCTLSIARNEVESTSADAGPGDGSADGGTASFHFRASGSGSCSAPFTPDATTGTLSIGAYDVMFDVTRG